MTRLLEFGQPAEGIIQVAFIVPDIMAALEGYAKRLNCGPWFSRFA